VSPLLSGVISVLLYTSIRYLVLNASDPIARGLLCLPVIYGVTIFINAFAVVHDGSSLLYFDQIPLWGAFVASIGLGLVAVVVVHYFLVPIMKKKIAAVGSIDGTMDVVKRESYMVHAETEKGATTLANGKTSYPVVEQVPAGGVTSLGHDNPGFIPRRYVHSNGRIGLGGSKIFNIVRILPTASRNYQYLQRTVRT